MPLKENEILQRINGASPGSVVKMKFENDSRCGNRTVWGEVKESLGGKVGVGFYIDPHAPPARLKERVSPATKLSLRSIEVVDTKPVARFLAVFLPERLRGSSRFELTFDRKILAKWDRSSGYRWNMPSEDEMDELDTDDEDTAVLRMLVKAKLPSRFHKDAQLCINGYALAYWDQHKGTLVSYFDEEAEDDEE